MSKEQQAQQNQKNQAQKRPLPSQEMAPAVEALPAAATLVKPGQLDGFPAHPTARPIRQAAVRRMQQQQGNAAVQRFLARSQSQRANGQGRQVAEAENGEGAELLGAGTPTLASAPPPPTPNENGNGSQPAVNGRVVVQREEEGDGDKPTEAEKEAALAAARAAEGEAGQAKDQGLQEADKSKAAKESEKQAGESAKEKVGQAKDEAQSVQTGKPGANGSAPKPAAAKAAPSEMGEALPEAEPVERGADYVAPQSPEKDPAFQKVTGNIKQVGDKEKDHVPAKQKADEAQDAAAMPASEQTAHAQNTQAGKIESAEAPPFDKAAFKARLMQRIQEMAPKNAEQADEFKDSGKLDGLKGDMNDQVGAEKDKTRTPMAEAAAEQPDTGAVPPKPVTPIPGAAPGAPPPAVGAEAATPKAKGKAEVEAPLREESRNLDKEMADNDVTEDQLANSNEPEFTGAVEAKEGAQTHAKEAPQEYRVAEQEHIATAESEATAVAEEHTQSMHSDRASLLTQIQGNQDTAKSEDEQARQKVAADINRIYEETKTKTEQILTGLDAEVAQVFEAGAQAAKQAFEDLVDRRMEAYKEKRYGGWFGWAKWIKDKIAGMPSAVNAFYTEGRNLFLRQMDQVIDNVVEIIARRMAEAKAEIANGKKRIQEYVAQLPEDLQAVGQEAADNVQSKFDQLEDSVNNKQGELVDTLASKYQEHLQAVDARIEELKAANAGLIEKALNAIVGVIKIILQLKDMLLNVLARIAQVVGAIIKAPVEFLGNLIDAVKQGFNQFKENFVEHLQEGFVKWLTGTISDAGIEMPENFDLPGIFQLVMQILGVSFEQILGKVSGVLGFDLMGVYDQVMELVTIYQEEGLPGLAKYGLEQLIGAEGVEALMEVVRIVQVLMSGDFGQFWEIIQEHLTDLKELVFGKIEEYLVERVIKAGITWLLSLFSPAGAFIRACKMIYDVVMFFVERGSQVMDLVNAILDSIGMIVAGNISSAANYIEETLAKAIPVAIGFMGSLLSLGNISEKVQEIIESVRGAVDRAIDSVLNSGPVQMVAGFIGRAVSRVQSFVERGVERAGAAIGFGGEGEDEGTAGETPAGEEAGGLNQLDFTVKGDGFAMAGEGHSLTAKVQDGQLVIIMKSDPLKLQAAIIDAKEELGESSRSPEEKKDILGIMNNVEEEIVNVQYDWNNEKEEWLRGTKHGYESEQAVREQFFKSRLANIANRLSILGTFGLKSLADFFAAPPSERYLPGWPSQENVGNFIRYYLYDRPGNWGSVRDTVVAEERPILIQSVQAAQSAKDYDQWQELIDSGLVKKGADLNSYDPTQISYEVDHIDPVSKRWNDGGTTGQSGREGNDSLRIRQVTERENLKLVTREFNRSKGGETYTPHVGESFTSNIADGGIKGAKMINSRPFLDADGNPIT